MDPISNMLVQIKNAQAVRLERTVMPYSKMKWEIANILKNSGYVGDIEKKIKKGRKDSELGFLEITLKYDGKHPAISGINRVSKPSRHLYIKAKEIRPIRSGYGLSIVSTSKGVMTSKEAWKQKLGGEVLFEIW